MNASGNTELPGGQSDPGNGSRRDLRIDFLRGIAMMMVVIAHIEIPSAYHYLTKERIGVVSEPEAFILLSGLVIGLVYPLRIAQAGWKNSAIKLFRRGLQLYLVSLSVVISVYLLRFIPVLNSNVLSTFTDPKTHVDYDLYDNTGGDAISFIKGFLLLRFGPGQFNIIGLFVLLMFAAPFILWALERKQTLFLVILSGGLYIYNGMNPTRLTSSQFENAFSLLAWQMLFVLGIIIGYHREQWSSISRGRRGRSFSCYTYCSPDIGRASIARQDGSLYRSARRPYMCLSFISSLCWC